MINNYTQKTDSNDKNNEWISIILNDSLCYVILYFYNYFSIRYANLTFAKNM